MFSSSVKESFCGRGLNPTERQATRLSLLQIQLDEDFASVRLWGKIFGVERDYIVADAVTSGYEVTHKYFFSSDAGRSFAQLPLVERWMHEVCLRLASRFTGTESHVYADPAKEPADVEKGGVDGEEPEEEEEVEAAANEEQPEEDDEDAKTGEEQIVQEPVDEDADCVPPPRPQVLTELHRLAWTVQQVNRECALVPIGALRLTVRKQMVKNPLFNGLTRKQLSSLESFLHWRTPESKRAVSVFRRPVAVNGPDFLDTLEEDVPRGCWRLRTSDAGLCASVRNLLWPGFEFRCQVGDPSFVQGYFGTGIRQNDLVFLL